MKRTITVFVLVVSLFLSSIVVRATTIGDVDGDKAITAADARLALRAAVGLEQYKKGSTEYKACDVDFDGTITAADARLILRAAVGLETLKQASEQPEEPTSSEETTKPEETTVPEETTKPEETTVPEETTKADNRPGELSSDQVYSLAEKYMFQINIKSDEGAFLGSGFSIDTNGTIVTNYHVIEGAYSIIAKDYYNHTYTVTQVLAYDIPKDLAVIKINASTTPAVLNKSDYKTGDKVYTLGSSKGFIGTFADGLISNKEVDYPSLNDRSVMMKYIQTSAPISSGNSGGPLIDTKGRVIGVNTWTRTDGQNLNFAVPVYYLDTLDYTLPITVNEFYKIEHPNIEISVTSKTLGLTQGAIAFLFVNVSTDQEITITCSCSTDRVYLEWGEWYGDEIILYIYADSLCTGENIRISIKEYPSICVDVSFSVFSKDTGLQWQYFPFPQTPDFGIMTSVTPFDYYETSKHDMFGAVYSTEWLAKAGYTNINTIRNNYANLLINKCGYSYVGVNTDDPNEVIWFFRNDATHQVLCYIQHSNDGGKTVKWIRIVWWYQ